MADFVEKHFTSRDGLGLYYRDYPGPPDAPLTLLCIPGLTRNSRDFEDVAAHYARFYRILCVDLRGRGKSEYAKDPMTYQPPQYVDDVGRLFKAAGVREAVFVGTSLGGLVSMMCANVMRHRVKAVVLNDIGPHIEASGLERIRGYVGNTGGFPTWEDAAEAVRRNNAGVFPRWLPSDWMTLARRTCAVRPDGTIAFDYDPAIAAPFNTAGPTAQVDLWPLFEGLQGLPVLAVRGALSDILSAEGLARMKQRLADLRVAEVADVGHAPFLMEPEARTAMEAFFAGLPPSGGWIYRARQRFASLRQLFRIMKHYKR